MDGAETGCLFSPLSLVVHFFLGGSAANAGTDPPVSTSWPIMARSWPLDRDLIRPSRPGNATRIPFLAILVQSRHHAGSGLEQLGPWGVGRMKDFSFNQRSTAPERRADQHVLYHSIIITTCVLAVLPICATLGDE